jgi:hypothetical protein
LLFPFLSFSVFPFCSCRFRIVWSGPLRSCFFSSVPKQSAGSDEEPYEALVVPNYRSVYTSVAPGARFCRLTQTRVVGVPDFPSGFFKERPALPQMPKWAFDTAEHVTVSECFVFWLPFLAGVCLFLCLAFLGLFLSCSFPVMQEFERKFNGITLLNHVHAHTQRGSCSSSIRTVSCRASTTYVTLDLVIVPTA